MLARIVQVLIASAVVFFSVLRPVELHGATLDDLAPAGSYQTAGIIFNGNHQLSDSDLSAVMRTATRPVYQFWKKRPPFDPKTFAADLGRVRRLYETRGFYNTAVTYQLELKGKLVTAHIDIHEGNPVRIGAVNVLVGEGAPQPAALDPQFKLPLETGKPFQESNYKLAEQHLLELYQRHGYAFVEVKRSAQVYLASGLAYLWYKISPGLRGKFGPTTVAGNRRVDSKLVLRELTYHEGELFDAGKVAASRQNILNLNLFSSVEFVPERDTLQRPLFPILIKLHEKPPRELALGLGYNTETLFNATLQWNQYNWLGGGRQLLLTATYSDITSSLDARLIQPYLFSRETRGILEAIQAQETYQTYTLNASRFRPRIDYFIPSRLVVSLGWRLEYLKFNSLDPRTIAAEGGVRRQGILSGPNGYLNYNTTDDPLDPHRGMILGFDGNVADHSLGGDYRYWRVAGEVRNYRSLGWETVFASRFRLGLADTLGPPRDIPLSERFYSGGENSVRGYGLRRIGPLSAANEPLGGLSLVEGSVELRRPLFWKLAGAVFFDCGQVSTHRFRIPIDALQCGYGPALSFATPVGPARVDLGFPTRRPRHDSVWQIYFSIGQFY